MMLSRPKDFMRHVKQSLFGDLQTMGTTQILQQMDAKNADILQDPNFEAWALSNTTMAMRQQADVDPQARQFIFNSYRSMNGKPQNQPAAANTPAVDAAGAAPVPTTNRTVSVSPSVTGPSTTTSKPGAKIWSRAEIRDLVANDPAGYQKLSGEIAKAYAEGRVQK
jgi:hypothetical protein